ncbi:MAG: aminopeptidase P family N-terminal domain-containing protein, partial [Clostridiales bacterium]|nr:aminopeptidase P family N-terminal domain-containing protein [Clostridiales bacterium]
MTAAEKLSALRARMDERGLDAYIVVSADAHQSEYVSDYWRGRAWLSGFDGSAGKVAVIRDEAGLWTDGRYFIQAENQIKGSGITLYKMDVDGVPELNEWLKEKLPENGRLGFDGRTVSVFDFDGMKKDLASKKIAFEYGADLLGEIWNDRPPLPTSPAFEHAAQFSGASRMEKLKAVREEMRKKGADYYLVASLDDIAWLLNIRGNDVPMTPVVYAYCLIGMDCAYLFVDSAKIGA